MIMRLPTLFFIAFIWVTPISASTIIQKIGHYKSPKESSELHIQEKKDQIEFKFTYTGQDGRSSGTSGHCDASLPWAFFFQNETTLWIYKGGDTVMSIDVTEHSGPQVSFSVGKTILQIKSERAFIPKELLEFIEKTPN